VPLTDFQSALALRLSENRTEDSYLCGGAALHLEPNSLRYSNDLDFFHDSVERVATAFERDRASLAAAGYAVSVDLSQPGYIRATVGRGGETTKVEWAHDSAWRFLPTVRDARAGYVLHPVDLSINKVLTLAGRDEPRDFIDVVFTHRTVLPLGAQCWAAPGKDPGFSPLSLLELLRRRGRHRPEELARLALAAPLDSRALKAEWLEMISSAERFISSRPPHEIGCLYYSVDGRRFVAPAASSPAIVPHYGRPGGVLPRVVEA
jgi:hypothetical protein